MIPQLLLIAALILAVIGTIWKSEKISLIGLGLIFAIIAILLS